MSRIVTFIVLVHFVPSSLKEERNTINVFFYLSVVVIKAWVQDAINGGEVVLMF